MGSAMNNEEMAASLLAARGSGRQCELDWPKGGLDVARAMEIQGEVFKQLGSPLIGWKIGATNEAAQKAFGIDAPFYGPMPQSAVMESGISIAKAPTVGACEPEYAFKMARDYPATGETVNEETLAGAVGALHIAIEVIGRAVGSAEFQNGIGVTLDFGGNVAFVVGPEIEDWQMQAVADAPVDSMVDGSVVQSGTGASNMGSPLKSLLWLAKKLVEQGGHLKAGEWISTGTCTPPVPAQAGTTYSAKFGDFGEVRVAFT